MSMIFQLLDEVKCYDTQIHGNAMDTVPLERRGRFYGYCITGSAYHAYLILKYPGNVVRICLHLLG